MPTTPYRSPEQTQELVVAGYRIISELGRGGMGIVYLAHDLRLNRHVALKRLLPWGGADEKVQQRFRAEAEAVARLTHPHIAPIFASGEEAGQPWFVMEYIDGGSLAQALGKGPHGAQDSARLVRLLARAIHHVHQKGIIHRDLKPGNILLAPPTDEPALNSVWGCPKVSDFGLARRLDAGSPHTISGTVAGTLAYMAPEQAEGRSEAICPATDVYALGGILYRLLTGRVPFEGGSMRELLNRIVQEAPEPPRRRVPTVPAALEAICLKCLAKSPADRYASAADLAADLDRFLAGEEPTASRTANPPRPRRLLVRGVLSAAVLLVIIGLALRFWPTGDGSGSASAVGGRPIRVGVLHSRTGSMAISERPVIDAVQQAIHEINESGGVLGRPIEAVLADGESDETVFARQAEKLITQDKVCTIFGCWTSASRKAVLPVVARHNHLLFYPAQYEGLEVSPHVVYLGPVPNQQILPALRWLVGFEGKKRWFLIGSDYVFPHTANAIISDEARARGCEVVGEVYLPLTDHNLASVVGQIVKCRADLIVNTISGDSNLAFFRALRRAGITSKKIPTVSFSISEEELYGLSVRDSAGDYVAANYFHTLDTPANKEFVSRFTGRYYGNDRAISSAMETAYAGVHLWAQTMQQVGRSDAGAIREAVKGQSYDAPQGPMRIDPDTQHTVQITRVGQIDERGRLREVYRSPEPEMAVPFPPSRSREEWQKFLDALYKGWGGRWSNPGP
jgi:urea transport system substrate-binding protein